MATNLNLSDQIVTFANPSPSVKAQLFATADIFVSPSDSLQETFGLSLLEAMAHQLPVVASDWSGYRDIVVHGHTGFLVPTVAPEYDTSARSMNGRGSRFSEDFLARTTLVDTELLFTYLQRLVQDPELRGSMGSAGRLRYENEFTWSQVIRKYEEIWLEMIDLGKQNKGVSVRSGLDLSSYAPHEIFETFPSRWQSSGVFEISALGRKALEEDVMLQELCMPEEWFRLSFFREILTIASAGMPVSTGSVSALPEAETVAGDLRSVTREVVATSHLFRLAKYGLLTLL